MEKENYSGYDGTVILHNMVMHTKVLGPETRTAIWFQGCQRRCPGCMSPASRAMDGGRVVKVCDVVQAVLTLKDIEGVTISGGEPFLQPDALLDLLKSIRQNSDLGIITYTGNTLEELRELHSYVVNEILDSYVDCLIDGEYIDELNDGMALKGSSNQKVHFLTGRYLPYRQMYERKARNVEVIATEKDMFFVGVPAKETLQKWRKVSQDM